MFNKSICVQLQRITFIHLQRINDTHPTSRKIYLFTNVILIQKNYIHSTNFCSRKQDHIIRSKKLDWFNNFLFFQEIHSHSTKPIKKYILSSSRVLSPSRLSFQQIKFPDIVDKNMHSTNLAVPTSADLKSLHIIQFSRRYQVLIRFSIEFNARQ